jgi:apolipoprotein N-acyltransferase
MLLTALGLVFSGLAQAAISPPLGWLFLHPWSWVPALAVFSRLEGRRALAAGWIVGTSAELAIYCWLPGTVIRFGDMPAPVGVLVWLLYASFTGFYAAVFAWGFGRVRRVAKGGWPFAVAAWFCAAEFLNPQLFGYLQGVAWYQVPSLFLVVAATGLSGASFLVLAVNAWLLQGVEIARGRDADSRSAWIVNAVVLAVLLAGAALYSHLRLQDIAEAERAAEPLTLALVQPNHTIPLRKAMDRQSSDSFAKDLVALSREAKAPGNARIDVYVWPEGALRVDPSQRRNAAVLLFAQETGAEIWLGANHYERDPDKPAAQHVSAFRVMADGRLDQRYDKNVLVPFGEYMPLRRELPFLPVPDAIGRFDAGTRVPKYDLGRTRFVFAICYEAIRAGFVREALGEDANLLVNVTIDAWYGELSEQSQHLMLAAAQAALNGVPLVRATSTGISAFVDARGVLAATTGNFTRETLVREVRPVRVPGPYSRHGEWFAWGCVAASALMLALARRRRG